MKNEIKCYCGKWAKQAKLKIEGLTIDAWKCTCGEQFLSPQDSIKISAIKKLS